MFQGFCCYLRTNPHSLFNIFFKHIRVYESGMAAVAAPGRVNYGIDLYSLNSEFLPFKVCDASPFCK